MSYGPTLQEIKFTSYNLICLSGKNGHGKSAMLDAMTWAIWGQARKTTGTSKADQGLLRLGATNMVVILDFMFNDETYRVRREVSFHYSKPSTTLDFGVLGEDEAYTALSEKTIRMTQAKIEKMIGLDYDAFVNSAFLRQGQSNEFSKKTPKERKEVLASILGLEKFELLKKKATDKARGLQSEKNSLDKLYEHIETQLSQKETVTTELADVKKQGVELLRKQKLVQKEREQWNVADQKLQEEEKKIAATKGELNQLLEQKLESEKQLKVLRSQWKSIHHQRCAAQDVDACKAKHDQLQQIVEKLKEKRDVHVGYQQKQLELKHALQTYKQQREQSHLAILQQYKSKLQEVTSEINILEHQQKAAQEKLATIATEQKELVVVQEKGELAIEKLTNMLKEYGVKQREFDKRRTTYQRFLIQQNNTNNELNELIAKEQLTNDPTNPSCPLCEQNLSASRKRLLATKMQVKKHWLEHRKNRFDTLIPTLKKALIYEHEQLKVYEDHTRAKDAEKQLIGTTKIRLDALSKDKDKHTKELDGVRKKMKESQGQLDEVKKTLAEEEKRDLFAKDESYILLNKQKTELDNKLNELNYKEDELKRQDLELKALAQQVALGQKDQAEIAKLPLIKQQVHDICAMIRTRRKSIEKLQKLIGSEQVHLQERNSLTKSYQDINRKVDELLAEKEALIQKHSKLELEQKKLDGLEKDLTAHQKTITSLDKEIIIYKEVVQALSKDGIQALLIEDAIPEIEHEANEILSRLTDNRAQIFIESLRDLKGGGTRETLDIKISDGVGLRPYEMFSGGEAFRIDFALRIAISKLLARRAGTSLQTLIIDEGFGSQDEEGLSHIMDSIHTIQEDFAKVIVVSHLPSMKDSFPVHFVIEKGAVGSQVSIIEQG